MAQYVLMLREDPSVFESLSPEEMQKVIGRYMAWSDGMKEKGKLIGGQKLVDGEGRVIRATNGTITMIDGPFAETKELLGGYFILDVSGYDEVRELVADCPHLEFGSIEVRQIHVLDE